MTTMQATGSLPTARGSAEPLGSWVEFHQEPCRSGRIYQILVNHRTHVALDLSAAEAWTLSAIGLAIWLVTGQRNLTAASDDPGNFSIDSGANIATWVCNTLVIEPGSGGLGGGVNKGRKGGGKKNPLSGRGLGA